ALGDHGDLLRPRGVDEADLREVPAPRRTRVGAGTHRRLPDGQLGDVPDQGCGHGRQCSVTGMDDSSAGPGAVRLLHDDDRDRYEALEDDAVVAVLYYGDEPGSA